MYKKPFSQKTIPEIISMVVHKKDLKKLESEKTYFFKKTHIKLS